MYLMTDILKWVKVSVLDIELSLYYAPQNETKLSLFGTGVLCYSVFV